MTDEALWRLGVFGLCLALLLVVERYAPRRRLGRPRRARWPANLALPVAGVVLARLALPVLPIGAAVWAAANGIGVLHNVTWPGWLEVGLAVIALDFVVYWQHRLMHAVPWLWRLHRMHHSDTDFDVTTGVRFHPLEIVFSMLLKIAAVVALGAPLLAVLVFEILLNATALFNHSNIRLPAAADRWLRACVVTPDMHRVHHSVRADEHNRNFGFCLSIWDRLFASYRAQPADGHLDMRIGLDRFRAASTQSLGQLLLQPFR